MSKVRLSSWKEIAAYLKCDESTARRWKRDNRLPVYRVGNKGSSVHAFTDELDNWVRERSQFDHADGTKPSADKTGEPSLEIPNPPFASSPIGKLPPKPPLKRRGLLIAIYALAGVTVISGLILLVRRSTATRAGQSAGIRELGAGQSIIDFNKIDNSAGNDQNEEQLAIHLKTFVKETQIWEMLVLYPSPWNCDARDVQRYWLAGSKAFNDVGASVSRLNERGWHYGYDSRLLDFQFRYVRIAPDGSSATVGTREHWWLPLHTRDDKPTPYRNPDQGPYEIEYLLAKVNGFWYIKSTSTPYMQWKPKEITCRNWPQSIQSTR